MNNREVNIYVSAITEALKFAIIDVGDDVVQALGFKNRRSLQTSYYVIFDVYFDPFYYTDVPVKYIEEAGGLKSKNVLADSVAKESYYRILNYYCIHKCDIAPRGLHAYAPEELSLREQRLVAITLITETICGPLLFTFDQISPRLDALYYGGEPNFRAPLDLLMDFIATTDFSKEELSAQELKKAQKYLAIMNTEIPIIINRLSRLFPKIHAQRLGRILGGLKVLMEFLAVGIYLNTEVIHMAINMAGGIAGSCIWLLTLARLNTPELAPEVQDLYIQTVKKAMGVATGVYAQSGFLDFLDTIGIPSGDLVQERAILDLDEKKRIITLIKERLHLCAGAAAASAGTPTLDRPGRTVLAALKKSEEQESIMGLIEEAIQDCLSY
jgi:hypothetical protein